MLYKMSAQPGSATEWILNTAATSLAEATRLSFQVSALGKKLPLFPVVLELRLLLGVAQEKEVVT
ncbi:hypothetical protein JQ600_04795 [Bradyrhizobium sp. AUGA SZCCT0176]|nr:hypothetical protein [Bradyrhizobium sp. AUGA SZCCT0176]MBR1237699.1 hypothetical protein [Bradyrhizobium sp. AUGA SZCCT0182]MBR1301808.1 hypothetical protein [Bradyrhizobium sp. AUGA SZCCT0042]